MKRILCVWELGGHLGHVTRLASLVPALRAEGFDVCFALSDVTASLQALGGLGVPVFQAPVWSRRVPAAPQHPISLSEILPHFGYYDAQGLASLFAAWRTLIDTIKPDLVLGDYSPNAFTVARSMGIATATIGNGFTIPPLRQPLPSYIPTRNPDIERLQRSDQRVLDTANSAARFVHMAEMESAADLWRTDETFLCTYPEIDHYGPRSDTKYWGGVAPPAGAIPAPIESTTPRVTAYLKRGHDRRVLEALAGLGWQGHIFAPALPPAHARRFDSVGLRVYAQPLSLSHALAMSDIVICHAGHDTTIHSLLAGKPLLLLPLHMEQRLTAGLVERLGAGLLPTGYPEPGTIVDTLRQLAENSVIAHNAKSFAERHKARSDVAGEIAKRCRALT